MTKLTEPKDLQQLLGYDEWRNFMAVIATAKTACELSGHITSDHFIDVNKTIQMPKRGEKEAKTGRRVVTQGNYLPPGVGKN